LEIRPTKPCFVHNHDLIVGSQTRQHGRRLVNRRLDRVLDVLDGNHQRNRVCPIGRGLVHGSFSRSRASGTSSYQRMRIWKVTMPLSPGGKVPWISQRSVSELASLGWVVNRASRSVRAVPATYSKRVIRLSVTTTPVIGCRPVFVYRMKKVMMSPTRPPHLSGHLSSLRQSGYSGASGGGHEPVTLPNGRSVAFTSTPSTRPITAVPTVWSVTAAFCRLSMPSTWWSWCCAISACVDSSISRPQAVRASTNPWATLCLPR